VLTCGKYHETARCSDLFSEYHTQKHLSLGVPTAVDYPVGNPNAFLDRIYVRAAKAEVGVQVKNLEESGVQKVKQMISTASAVNQTGAQSGSSGSTSLVKLPTATDLISFAAESGAFTDTANGTTTTVQGSVYGVSKYLDQIGENQGNFFAEHGKLSDALEPWTFSATLNVTQSSATTTSSAQSANSGSPFSLSTLILPSNNASLSSVGTSYAIFKKVNQSDAAFLKNWNSALASSGLKAAETNVAKTVNGMIAAADPQKMMTDPKVAAAFSAWQKEGANAENGLDFDGFVAAYSSFDDACATFILSQPGGPDAILQMNNALNAYQNAVYSAFDSARGKPLLSLGYTYSTAAQVPATHNGTIALSYLFKGKSDPNNPKTRNFWTGDQLTGNFSASWYSTLPSGATYGRFRDSQLALEFDKPFGGTVDSPIGTWSLAGYGQYQYDPTVLNITAGNLAPGTNINLPSNAQVLLGKAGWTGVVQGKLVFNLKQGLNIPLAVKWSNRTDLLSDSNDVRGQIGLSYDLAALKSLISGKN
jgi:hypothetical protein